MSNKLIANNFHCMVSAVDKHYTWAKFHMFLAYKLQQVVEGKIKRLCVSVPPRHGKSKQISELLPAYALGREPSENVMAISYAAKLSAGFGSEVRRIVCNPNYKALYPNVRIAGKGHGGAEWDLVGYRQSYYATGVGGGITGRPCTLGLIDDAIKNRAQANSATYQRGLRQFFGADFFSRLEPNARAIVVNTRWSKRDLIGYILENLHGWEYIRLPAICDSKDDPLGREIGEPLFPQKYDEAALAEIRATVGELEWASLYQQDPVAGAGALWRPMYNRILPTRPAGLRRVLCSWDCASELHDLADYTVCTVWGELSNGAICLLHCLRARLTFTQLVRAVNDMNERFNPDKHIVEKASNGIALLQYLADTPETKHIRYEAISAQRNKQLLFSTCTPMLEAGEVLFWQGADNVEQVLTELAEYPSGDYDDCAISSIQAFDWFQQNRQIISYKRRPEIIRPADPRTYADRQLSYYGTVPRA